MVTSAASHPVRPAARVFWFRRFIAVLVVGVFFYGVWSLATLMFGQLGTSAAVAAPATNAASAEAPVVHIVESGDTLWSVAQSLEIDSDIREVVDALVELNGSPSLEVGQRLVLPSS